MVMLSELLQYQVMDTSGVTGRVGDLAIDKLDIDYPPVTHLVIQLGGRSMGVLPWKMVKAVDRKKPQIQVEDLEQIQEIDSLGQAVLLRRDVLDALILELQNRRVTRVNDLWLSQKKEGLQLSAADTSAQGILRRLTRGRYSKVNRRKLYDWKYIEFLRGDPQAVDAGAGYSRRIIRLPPGEIASLASSIPYLHAAELLELLPVQLAADTLEVMSLERQLQVFEELDEKSALDILGHMAPDLAADILGRVSTDLLRKYLNRLPKPASERIVELLRYPENSVGGIMSNDMVTVSPNLKIGRARTILREKMAEPDFVYFIYVVDDAPPHKLRGVLSLRQLLMAGDDEVISEIMNPYLITLSPFQLPHEAGYRLLSSQLAALPVVGGEGQLLGTVTIDAAVSQIAPPSWRAQAPKVFS